MPRVERICPECGASNSYRQTRCAKCHAPLTGAVPQAPPTPLLTRRGMAGLAWRVTKFLTIYGFNVARKGAERGVDRMLHPEPHSVKSETIEGDYTVPTDPAPADAPRLAASTDWRVYSAKPEPDKPKDAPHWGPKK